MSRTSVREQFRAKTTLITAMRSSPAFKDYVELLKVLLASERDAFEAQTASEYTRGRINMLKDIIKEIE